MFLGDWELHPCEYVAQPADALGIDACVSMGDHHATSKEVRNSVIGCADFATRTCLEIPESTRGSGKAKTMVRFGRKLRASSTHPFLRRPRATIAR
jgi:hypothetical protein